MFKAPILPIFMHYDADGSCRAKIYPPLYAPKTKNKEQDLYDVTEKLIAILEQEIRSNPPMWFWVHDRWKDGRERFGHK
jgi:KDO2-lipid IV(A) lauroyltransferase